MANNIFGALRIWARQQKIAYRRSPQLRRAVSAVFDLADGNLSNDYDVHEPEIDRRSLSTRRAIRLQKQLELDHDIPHLRSLEAATAAATADSKVPPSKMKIVLQGNAARHQKWKRKSCEWTVKASAPRSSSGDPWWLGDDPWSSKHPPCRWRKNRGLRSHLEIGVRA